MGKKDSEVTSVLSRAIMGGLRKGSSADTDYLLVDLGQSFVENLLATLARMEMSRLVIIQQLCEELNGKLTTGACLAHTVTDQVILNGYISGGLSESTAAAILCSRARPEYKTEESVQEFLREVKAESEDARKNNTTSAEKVNTVDEIVWSLHEVEEYFRRSKNGQ